MKESEIYCEKCGHLFGHAGKRVILIGDKKWDTVDINKFMTGVRESMAICRECGAELNSPYTRGQGMCGMCEAKIPSGRLMQC